MLQDWFYIHLGEKKPFDYSFEEDKLKLQIPFSENLKFTGDLLLAQQVDDADPGSPTKLPLTRRNTTKIDYETNTIYHDNVRKVFLSRVYGYAGFINGKLKVTPPVVINRDKTLAKLLIQNKDPRRQLTVDEVFKIIDLLKLFPSIDRYLMEKELKALYSSDTQFLTISRGRSMKKAHSAYVIPKLVLEKKVGTIKEDGSIDYKEREAVKEVFQGDIVGEYFPEFEGNEGFNIYGQRVAIQEENLGPSLGENLFVDPENPKIIRSSINGYLKLENGVLSATETLVIPGDVDYETGNIEFSGNIEIKGKVTEGFTVTSFGNLTVHGVVEAANLFSSQDMFLHSGVIAKEGYKIECLGNFHARYVQNAHIHVKGDLKVDDFIYHSHVECNNEVLVHGKSGVIMGGKVIAFKKIEADVAGNKLGVATELFCGVDLELEDKIKKRKNEINVLLQRQEMINTQLKKNFPPHFLRAPEEFIRQLPEEKKGIAIKVLEQVQKVNQMLKKLEHEVETLEKKGDTYNFVPEIIIHKQKYNGVKERIVEKGRI